MNTEPIERDDPSEAELLAHWENLTGHVADEWRPKHRAPRVWLSRHTRAVVALAAATLALGGSAAATAGDVERLVGQTDVWAAPSSFESIVEPPAVVSDPAPVRRAEGRATRAQRRDVAPRAPRWVAPLLGKLRPTSCYGAHRGHYRHGGLDLDGETGDTVRSVGTGVVVQTGRRWSASGITVTVRYGDALVMYAHLSRTSVRVGAHVRTGQKVGEVGTTGVVTGSHLHLGVSRTTALARFWDRLTNPAPWLEARGVAVPGRC